MSLRTNPSEMYRIAIEHYVRIAEDKTSYVFIYSNSELDTTYIPSKIDEKQIVFVNTDAEVFSFVEQVALVLEIERLVVNDNEALIKINHNLLMELNYPFDVAGSRRYLSPIDRETLDQSVVRAEKIRLQTGIDQFLSLAQNAWTYVRFKPDSEGNLTFDSIETVTERVLNR